MKELSLQPNTKNQNSSDWICLNCNNLNYSFRKICNRCKMVTQQQNRQNYIHMQYYQAYYQHPYIAKQEDAMLSPTTQKNHLTLTNPQTQSRPQDKKTPPSSVNSHHSLSSEGKLQDWSTSESQTGFLFLVDNAWQGLYNIGEVSDFQNCEQIENTREQQEVDYQNEDILTNFDFTFI